MLRLTATLLLAVGIFAANTHADVLIASNGDRITGKLVGIDNGIIFFDSATFGVLKVAENNVQVELETAAETMTQSETTASVAPTENLQVQEAPSGAADTFAEASAGVWKKQVEFGLMAQNGHRSYSNYSAVLDISRNFGERDQLRFLLNRYYGKADGSVSADNTTASANFKKGLSEDFFFNATTSYESDSVKGLNHDAAQGFGVGMKLLQHERVQLEMGAGAAIRHRDLSSEPETWDGLVDAFQNFKYEFNDRLSLKQGVSVNAVPRTADNYQVRFKAALVSSISKALDMSVRYEYFYDGSIDQAIKDTERIITSIGYAF